MTEILVASDGDWEKPEVQVSGTSKALADFGLLLNSIKDNTTIAIESLDSEYYPINVKVIILEILQSGNDRLTVMFDEDKFQLSGSNEAFNKLGDSLVNFFDDETSIGEHFQLDYYEGNQVLNKTNCHLIFLCDHYNEK